MNSKRRRWTDAFLGVPLSLKLVAASVAVAAVVAAVTLLVIHRVPAVRAVPDGLLVGGAFVVGAAALAVLDGLLVGVALRPIRELERAASRVEEGDLSARAEATPFADRQLRRVTEHFNGALDGIAELRSRLRAVARQAVTRREEERRELADRLQEDVAQRIAACLLKLKVARGPAEHGERDRLLDELREEAAGVLEGVRRLARDLHPPELTDIGVGRAIQAFARSFGESTGLEVEVVRSSVDEVLADDARLTLYRTAQDLLMNVVQRTECSSVRIRLWPEPGRVVLELSQAENGAVPPAVRAGQGREPAGRDSGRAAPVRWADSPELLEIRERAGYVGGRILADGEAGRSRIRVEVPTSGAGARPPGEGTDRAATA